METAIMAGLVVVAAVAAYFHEPALAWRGLGAGGRLLGGVWVNLLLGILLAGFIEVLLPRDALLRWMGAESGARGITAGWVAGLLVPGGPYVSFPIAAGLLRAGAGPGPLIAFISAKTLLSPVRMLTYEAPLLGWPLTLARLLPGLLVPPVLGAAGQWLVDLFRSR
jgi:uncharacterized protein